jgi:hypothetical protein
LSAIPLIFYWRSMKPRMLIRKSTLKNFGLWLLPPMPLPFVQNGAPDMLPFALKLKTGSSLNNIVTPGEKLINL